MRARSASLCKPAPTRRLKLCKWRARYWPILCSGGPPAEVQAAKDNLIGGFALRLDSNRKLLDNVSNIAWYDLPLDYLDTWSDKVQRLTAADIQAAFARTLQPERMVTVVLGPAP